MGKRKRMKPKKNPKTKKPKEVESQGEYWVETVLDHGLHDNGTKMYLVKWEGYAEEDNSWEFEQHVNQCQDLIDHFLDNTVNGSHPIKWSWEEIDKLVEYLNNVVDKEEVGLMARMCGKSMSELRKQKVQKDIKEKVAQQLNAIKEVVNKTKSRTNGTRLLVVDVVKKVIKELRFEKNFQSITGFFEFVDGRPHTKIKLEEMENDWNAIIRSDKEGKPIKITNDVDCEVPSLERYVTDYILDVTKTDDAIENLLGEEPVVSCKCKDCYESRDDCCSAVHGFPIVYNKNGRLSHQQRERDIIFECNSKCKCGPNCANRQIQKGRQFDLEIFRTNNKGWGVRALEEIPKGSYITHYAGEVVSLVEATRRPTTYLFDLGAHLDSRDIEYTYVVDASKYGNVARFVNHSCAPNSRTLFAWIERSANTMQPIIALFSIKNIKPYEEITYDYSMEVIDYYVEDGQQEEEDESDVSDVESEGNPSEKDNHVREDSPIDGQTTCKNAISSKRNPENRNRFSFKQIECQCGADNCKKYLYS